MTKFALKCTKKLENLIFTNEAKLAKFVDNHGFHETERIHFSRTKPNFTERVMAVNLGGPQKCDSYSLVSIVTVQNLN